MIKIEKFIPGGFALGTADGGKKMFFWNAVPGETGVEGHAAVAVVAAENAGETVLERNHGTVKDAVGVREKVSGNHGVGTVAPEGCVAAGGAVFPGHLRKGIPFNNKLTHIFSISFFMVWSGLSPSGIT